MGILSADKCITSEKQLTKNPIHDKWEVIATENNSGIYTLAEMIEYVPDELKKVRPSIRKYGVVDARVRTFEETLDPGSRNCSLYENNRYYAYSIVNECSTQKELYQRVLDRLKEQNDIEIPKYFPDKLHKPELEDTASSISSWTYAHRNDLRRCNHGAMELPTMKGQEWTKEEYEVEVKDRRQQSAARTNKMRSEATREKIVDAIGQCYAEGKEPNISLIARIAGMPRKTVAYHKDLIIQE